MKASKSTPPPPPPRISCRRSLTLAAAALAATLVAAPVGASNNAVCQDIADNTGWRTGTWNQRDTRCVMSGRLTQQQADIEAADALRDHPEARAVYYGTPPAEMGTAEASIGSGMICITMPGQEPKLTTRRQFRTIEVYGGGGNHNPDVSVTESGQDYGHFLGFGQIQLQSGRQCVNGHGRFANAMVGSEFPVSLRPREIGRIVDATDPGRRCLQQLSQGGAGSTASQIAQMASGRCLQRHYAFRKEAHCAGGGETAALEAASCRIWVQVVQ